MSETKVENDKISNGADEKLLLPLPGWKVWYVMVIIGILLFIDMATRNVVGPLFPLIKKEFNLLDSQLGLINTVVLIIVTVLAMPLSYLIDRWSRSKMASLMAIIWSIGSLVSGWASSFIVLLLGRGLLGVAEASYNSVGQTYIMAAVKKKFRATVTGFLTMGMTLGIAGGALLGGSLGSAYGWRNTLLILAIPGIIFGILAWFLPDYKSVVKTKSGTSSVVGFGTTLKELFKNKSVVLIVIGGGLVNYLVYTIISWLPTYLMRFKEMSMAQAGEMTGLVLVAGIVGAPLGGWLGDFAGRKNNRGKIVVIIVAAILTALSTFGGVLFDFWPLFILTVLFIYLLIPSAYVAIQELVPAHQRASAFGFYYSGVFILGVAWAPWAAGAISDATNLRISFWVAAAVVSVSIILFVATYYSYKGDYENARKREAILGEMV